jgi:hypothetical protein
MPDQATPNPSENKPDIDAAFARDLLIVEVK